MTDLTRVVWRGRLLGPSHFAEGIGAVRSSHSLSAAVTMPSKMLTMLKPASQWGDLHPEDILMAAVVVDPVHGLGILIITGGARSSFVSHGKLDARH